MAYAGEYNYKFSPNGLIGRASHHEDSHDRIKFDCFYVVANEYISDNKGISIEDYQLMMVEADKVASLLIVNLMPKVFGRWLYNYLAMVAMGLVRSVATVNSILNWYALIVYILAIIITILVWRHNHNSEQVHFMALVLLMIVGNVTATSLMIMCISRYVLYNLPLFYMALLLEIKELIGNKEYKYGI
jgi:hypothetical protein